MRRDIEFKADNATLRGWLYLPDGGGRPAPTIVMAHGFSAVKEMCLDRYAEVFAAAGMAALVYDNRNFGASDGDPRQEIDPWAQVRDYRHAISYAQTLPEVDRNRIGVWGTSVSGGHVLVAAAIDRRVKCVASQVPLVSGWGNIQRLVRADMLALLRATMEADRAGRFSGRPPGTIPVVDPNPMAFSALPTPDSWRWFSETGKSSAPAWKNEVTLRSGDMLMEYEPITFVQRISPTPLLMIIAAEDVVAIADLALAAYHQALDPKKLVILRGGHYEAYIEQFDQAAGAARDWFAEHLRAR
jgi:uncharacterized protein